MKNLFFLVLIAFGFSFINAQMSVRDSISGGAYYIQGSPLIDSLVQKSVKAKCYNPTSTTPVATENYDPCAQNQKVMGYKIQVMYTKDRNAANRTQSEFAKKFPSMVPEMKYTQPDYRIMVGDYFTKKSAAMDLAQVKRQYPGAFLAQWSVWCRKAMR